MRLRFEITFGVTAGYHHANPVGHRALDQVKGHWIAAMEEEYKQSGIAISAVAVPSTTLYPQAFGCPQGGEETVTLTGIQHPYDTTQQHLWVNALYRVVRAVQAALQQTTACVVLFDAETAYFKKQETSDGA